MKWSFRTHLPVLALACAIPNISTAAPDEDERPPLTDPFRQLEETLPTPTSTRAASGAPGHRYWQQRADYNIKVRIDDAKQHLEGSQRIRYFNESPDTLDYVWLQLDANIYAPDSDSVRARSTPGFSRMPYRSLRRIFARATFDGSVKLTRVQSGGKDLNYVVVGTMMRIDLPKPLASGKRVDLDIDWNYAINDSDRVSGRTGYEFFEDDKNYIYEIAQWFPRMVAYTDVNGWQHKQFLGNGEFTLELGDYKVEITVPADHIVASTGVLKNGNKVLTADQRARLSKASKADAPEFIVTPEEATQNEAEGTEEEKTWVFHAKNVRDFAFATSRKFIWDAVVHDVNGRDVWAMSYYPNEGEPLWSRYSTRSIEHTLDIYSRYTFDYPYPVAISVNGPVGGMEYPMICFNGPRPEEDGTYTARTKYGLISVIIHEVGHNYFPMIVNSDERQWTWMDEGLNTFLQYLTEQEWEPDYPSRRGEPRNIVGYMASENQVPIMTNSESLLQFGNNAYAKPATALNVLRETVLGRELFDFAFKKYARRWKFRRPQPADFFRTMEDASGIDLDWFWRGWFYSTDHVDIGLTGIREFSVDTLNPEIEKALDREERDSVPESLSEQRDKDLAQLTDALPELKDFYNDYDKLDVTEKDKKWYQRALKRLSDEEKELLKTTKKFYVIDLENVGGLVMPVILQLHYADGSKQELRIPAEIWRRDWHETSKAVMTDKELVRVVVDPHLETADTDLSNNFYPPKVEKSRFELFKYRRDRGNPMRDAGLGDGSVKERSPQEKVDERERPGK
jgi:hypothetical protein